MPKLMPLRASASRLQLDVGSGLPTRRAKARGPGDPPGQFAVALTQAAEVPAPPMAGAQRPAARDSPFKVLGTASPDAGTTKPSSSLPSGPDVSRAPIWPPLSRRSFAGYRWAWPLIGYNGIGLSFTADSDDTESADGLGPVDATPGGLQLDVEPRRADVYVDGLRAGTVADFSGYYQHLEVSSGLHRIVILADGYDPLLLDIVVPPRVTTTYRGSLMRAPGR